MKLKYVNEIADRHGGEPFYYFRHRGKLTRIPGKAGTPEFMARYRELLASTRPAPAAANVVEFPSPAAAAPAPRPTPPRKQAPIAFLPGSIGWLIERYLASAKFRNLSAGSQDNYRRFLGVIKESEIGPAMAADLTRSNVAHFCTKIGEERGGARGVLALRLLSILWKFALGLPEAKIDDDAHNPTRDVELERGAVKSHLAWPQSVQERFLDGAGDDLRLAFYLLLYTGQRGSDVIKMKWSDYDERAGTLRHIVQQKTGETVHLSVHRELAKILATVPRIHENILTSKHRRKPYLRTSLTHAFERRLKKLGIKGYTMHGLRKTLGSMLAEADATELEIMRVLGHTKADQAHEYCREANKSKLTASAMRKLEAHDDRQAEREAR